MKASFLFQNLLWLFTGLYCEGALRKKSKTITSDLRNYLDLVEFNVTVNKVISSLVKTRSKRSYETSWFKNFSPIKYILAGLIPKNDSYFSCMRCQISITAMSFLARKGLAKSAFLEEFIDLCLNRQHLTKSVCDGLAESTGKSIYHILGLLDTDFIEVKEMACFVFFKTCKIPAIKLPRFKFPPMSHYLKNDKSTQISNFPKVLHLSDLHYDRFYEENSEANCNKPICCQNDSASDMKDKTILRPAGKWGDYKCDINKNLLNSLLSNARAFSHGKPYEMVLFTGDIPAHDLWKETEFRTKSSESDAISFLKRHFYKNKIYPAIGNHEAVPVNLFPSKELIKKENFDLYEFLSEQWKPWLPNSALESIRKGGYYSVEHSEILQVIAINSNFFYVYNFYNLLYLNDPDPDGMFKWLIGELFEAEKKEKNVYIIGHIPPGSQDFYPHWSNSYYSIIERFSHVISGQFFGHLHTDEFEIFYSSTQKISKTAINTAYMAPSMSTLNGFNPSFRIYQIDPQSFEIRDYIQYHADLKESNNWKPNVIWKALYDARSLFLENHSDFPTLNATFWHLATESMKKNSMRFHRVYNISNVAGLPLPFCDENCRNKYICALQAGRSQDNCNDFLHFT